VSLIKTNRTTTGMSAMGTRAKDAAAQAVPLGKRAGTTAVQGARQGAASARDWAAPRVQDAVPRVQEAVQDAVRDAREWAAPRLESAADAVTASVAPKVAEAVTTSVAPKVSAALRSTANQVRPDRSPSRTGLRRLLGWRWLLGVGVAAAAAGATAAVAMRRRYANATAEAKEATEPDAPEQAGEADAEAATRSQVNGRVTTPGS
jgi:hypothetical protein